MARRRREEVVEEAIGFNREGKIEAIKGSKMPDSQKEACIKALTGEPKEEGVPFSVYAKVRKIEVGRHKAMLSYPKAKNIRLASLKEWDEIFKSF